MGKILISIWLLCGIVAIWRDYHGFLKYWFNITGESVWRSTYGKFVLRMHAMFYAITFCFGPIMLVAIETTNDTHKSSWWFTTKNKLNK